MGKTVVTDEQVLAALKAKDGLAVGPTEIGLGLGLDYQVASSRMMGPLRRLVKAGRVEVIGRGKYRWMPKP